MEVILLIIGLIAVILCYRAARWQIKIQEEWEQSQKRMNQITRQLLQEKFQPEKTADTKISDETEVLISSYKL